MVAFIASLQSVDAVVNLAQYRLSWQTARGAEAAIITENAAAYGNGSVHIWTCKPGVDADSLDPVTKCLA